MKHRRPKFRLKFRPKEDRREERESKEGVFFSGISGERHHLGGGDRCAQRSGVRRDWRRHRVHLGTDRPAASSAFLIGFAPARRRLGRSAAGAARPARRALQPGELLRRVAGMRMNARRRMRVARRRERRGGAGPARRQRTAGRASRRSASRQNSSIWRHVSRRATSSWPRPCPARTRASKTRARGTVSRAAPRGAPRRGR